MPKVSICIPTYEQVEYLKKCLDSILIQNYSDYEVIITDDSRTDHVEKIVKEYDFNGRLKYIRNKERLGSPENWNEAIRRAAGDYIKVIHHDDWFENDDSLKEFVNLLDQNPESDFAFSASHVVFDDLNWIHSITEEQVDNIGKQPDSLYQGNMVGGPSATIFRNHRFFFDSSLKWLVDIDLYIRILHNNNSFVYSNQHLVTTYAAKGRVSDYCKGNKEVELFEYFYLFHKIVKKYRYISLNRYKSNMLFLISICKEFSIKNIKEVRFCGYNGKIHYLLELYFFCRNKHIYVERLFIKLIKLL